MTLPQHAFDYRKATIAELQGFIKARTGLVPTKRHRKVDHIRLLVAADRRVTFRFLDLPPELRNNVYRHLLILPSYDSGAPRVCWPQILRVSKEVHREAEGILYGDNVFQVKMIAAYMPNVRQGGVEWSFQYRSDSASREGSLLPVRHSLEGTFISWGSYLRKARQLKVTLGINVDATVFAQFGHQHLMKFEVMNHILYSLCSFLASENDLRRVEVGVEASTFPDLDGIAKDMLWPLVLLANADICHISGVSENAVLGLLALMRQYPKPAFDVLAKANALNRRSEVFRELSAMISTSTSQEDLVDSQTHAVRKSLRRTEYVDETRHLCLLRATTDLETALTGLSLAEMKMSARRAKDDIDALMTRLSEPLGDSATIQSGSVRTAGETLCRRAVAADWHGRR